MLLEEMPGALGSKESTARARGKEGVSEANKSVGAKKQTDN